MYNYVDANADRATEYTMEEVAKHRKKDDLWIVMNDNVYNITKWVDDHPGGEEVLMGVAGTDATFDFQNANHMTRAQALAEDFCIGVIKGTKAAQDAKEAKLKPKAPVPSPKAAPKPQGGSSMPLIFLVLALLAVAGWFFSQQTGGKEL